MSDITGLWSADLQYSPGAAADDVLAFFPDAKGYYAQYNWALCGYETFEYRIASEGVVELTGNRAYYNDGYDNFAEEEDLFIGQKFLSYRITDGPSPVMGTIPFLEFVGFSINLQTKFGYGRSVPSNFELPHGTEAPEKPTG